MASSAASAVLRRRRVAVRRRTRPRAPGRRGPGRTARRAARPPSSSSACAGRSRAASGRARRHRRRTAARGSSPAGPGRCPSAGTASCRRRETSPRVLASCVPCRAAASWATTTWCISGMLAWTSKMSAGSSTVPSTLPSALRTSTVVMLTHLPSAGIGLLAAVRTSTRPPFGPGIGALDQQQVLLGVDRVHGQVLHGGADAAHPAGHPQALEDAARGGAGADGAGRAVLALGAVPGAQTVEAVPLHDAGGALALGRAGDVDARAGGEHVRADLLAERVRRRRRRCAARRGAGAG